VARVAEIREKRATFVAQATQKSNEKTNVSKDWVIQRIVTLIDECTGQRAIEKTITIKRKNGPPAAVTAMVKERDNQTAARLLEFLGKDLGMAITRTESGKPGDFANSAEVAEDIIERLMLKGHTRDEAERIMAALYSATELP
jgi:hypothetical protein